MGEASVAFVLSSQQRRRLRPLLGGAMTNDAYHVVSIAPDHDQIKRCVADALADAGLSRRRTSPTSTPTPPAPSSATRPRADLLDTVLTNAQAVATKPFTGHCQGAAAAVELAGGLPRLRARRDRRSAGGADAHPRLLDGNRPP